MAFATGPDHVTTLATTALHIAAFRGAVKKPLWLREMWGRLAARGALAGILDHRNGNGRTALHVAAAHGNLAMAEALLSHGASANLRIADGSKTALDLFDHAMAPRFPVRSLEHTFRMQNVIPVGRFGASAGQASAAPGQASAAQGQASSAQGQASSAQGQASAAQGQDWSGWEWSGWRDWSDWSGCRDWSEGGSWQDWYGWPNWFGWQGWSEGGGWQGWSEWRW